MSQVYRSNREYRNPADFKRHHYPQVRLLDDRARTHEVARTLSGAKVTDTSLQNAGQMIAASRQAPVHLPFTKLARRAIAGAPGLAFKTWDRSRLAIKILAFGFA